MMANSELMRKAVIPLVFSELFPDERISTLNDALIFRLRQLNRTETIRLCAHINILISDPWQSRIGLNHQESLLKLLFDDRTIRRIQKLAQKHPTQKKGWTGEITVFHREQLLDLIRLATIHCPDTAKYESPLQSNRSKKTFVQAALLVSELLMDRTYAHVNLDADAETKRESTLEALRHSARYNSSTTDPIRAFGRGKLMFFEFLPQVFPDFGQNFQEHTGISLEDYFACLFLVITRYLQIDPRQTAFAQHIISLGELDQQMPHLSNTFRQYLVLESYTSEKLQIAFQTVAGSEYNLKPLRQRPILQLSENQAITLDPAFHTEKAMVGPLFAVPTIIGRLLGDFGKAFEKYIQAILQKMYPQADSGNKLFLNENLGDKKQTLGEIDAGLIESDQLLLFEMKAVWIRDTGIVQPDHEDYLTTLHEYTKGAHQLASVINNLIRDKAQIEHHDLQTTKRIYPVLVVYDSSLSVPGYTWFFAKEFHDALNPDGLLTDSHMIMTKGQWEVAPLTIMPIDVLENLEASIQNFTLTDLLKDYFSFRDTQFQGEADTLTLSEFISMSGYQQKITTAGSTIIKKALEIFKDAVKKLVPEDKQAELLSDL